MGLEIERKFLLKSDEWKESSTGISYRQGYLCLDPARTLRVRIAGDRAFLTIKGKSHGISRREYEYEIPCTEAEEMLEYLCLRPIVEKVRYRIHFGAHVWEIDEFHGDFAGLVLAEVELESEDEVFEIPPWIGREVSGDPRYFNSALVRRGMPETEE